MTSADRQCPKTHDLKTVQPFYFDVVEERKTFEIRKNDRDFRIGDILLLHEWDDSRGYSGHYCVRRVTYLVQGVYGLPADVCVMSLEPCSLRTPRAKDSP